MWHLSGFGQGALIPFGVIGNTTVFGAVVLGSNPGGGA